MRPLVLDQLQIDFDPPLRKRPRRNKRHVCLTTERGETLGGIVIHYQKGRAEKIDIPQVLTVQNRPEYGDPKFPLSELDRDVLRLWIREKLRYRPEASAPPEWERPGETVRLLRKAHAARSARRN